MPDVACRIRTAYDDDAATQAAVLAGAAGYTLKTIDTTTLLENIRAVGNGRSLLSAHAVAHATSRMRELAQEDPRVGSLGLRERQVLGHIADGLTNRHIGDRLGLEEENVT